MFQIRARCAPDCFRATLFRSGLNKSLGLKGLKMSFKHRPGHHASAIHHRASRATMVSRGSLVEQGVAVVASSVAASEISVSRFNRFQVHARSARPRCMSLRSSLSQRFVSVFIVKSSSSIRTASVSSARMPVHRLRSTLSPNKALKTDALRTARVLA